MAIRQKIIYTLSSSFVNRSLAGIGYDRRPTTTLLLFTIFEQMCITNFYDESKPPLNTLQCMVSKVLKFHENTDMLSSVDCYDLYLGNNEPT